MAQRKIIVSQDKFFLEITTKGTPKTCCNGNLKNKNQGEINIERRTERWTLIMKSEGNDKENEYNIL